MPVNIHLSPFKGYALSKDEAGVHIHETYDSLYLKDMITDKLAEEIAKSVEDDIIFGKASGAGVPVKGKKGVQHYTVDGVEFTKTAYDPKVWATIEAAFKGEEGEDEDIEDDDEDDEDKDNDPYAFIMENKITAVNDTLDIISATYGLDNVKPKPLENKLVVDAKGNVTVEPLAKPEPVVYTAMKPLDGHIEAGDTFVIKNGEAVKIPDPDNLASGITKLLKATGHTEIEPYHPADEPVYWHDIVQKPSYAEDPFWFPELTLDKFKQSLNTDAFMVVHWNGLPHKVKLNTLVAIMSHMKNTGLAGY